MACNCKRPQPPLDRAPFKPGGMTVGRGIGLSPGPRPSVVPTLGGRVQHDPAIERIKARGVFAPISPHRLAAAPPVKGSFDRMHETAGYVPGGYETSPAADDAPAPADSPPADDNTETDGPPTEAPPIDFEQGSTVTAHASPLGQALERLARRLSP